MLKSLSRLSAQISTFRAFSTSIPRRLPLEMEKVPTGERLAGLRGLMRKHKVDIYSKQTFKHWTDR